MLNWQISRQLFLRNMQIALLLVPILILLSTSARSKASKSLCKPHYINLLLEKGRKNPRAMNVSLPIFYKEVRRKSVLSRFRQMKDGGFVGIDEILKFWNKNTQFTDIRWLAYILATTYHETAGTMKPIREYGRGRGRRYGRPHKQTGKTYYGRGYVQLTWPYNYKNADKQLGRLKLPKKQQLYWNPGIAMEFNIAKQVLFSGMREGWFVKVHCLPRHFRPGRKADWKSARRIINGLDKWPRIKREALAFVDVIKKSQVPVNIDKEVEIVLNPPAPAPTKPDTSATPLVQTPAVQAPPVQTPGPDLQAARKVAAIYRKKLEAQTRYMEALNSKINRLSDENTALKIKLEQQAVAKPPAIPPEPDTTPQQPQPDTGPENELQQAVVGLLESNQTLVRSIEKNQAEQSSERQSLADLNKKVLQQGIKSNETLDKIVTLVSPPEQPQPTEETKDPDKTKDKGNTHWLWKYLWNSK